MSADQSLARRDALRIFRLILVIQLVFLGLSVLALLGSGRSLHAGFFLRATPTLLLALLFLPPWLEPVLGRFYLAVGLSLEVLFSSLEGVYLFSDVSATRLSHLGLPPGAISQLMDAPYVEPFFFLLIPLVLLAWGYGRRGALLGSTWAAALHLATGLWVLSPDEYWLFFAQGTLRVILLYLVPFLVSILAERERWQLAQLEAAHQRLRRYATTVEQLAISRERNRLARDLHDTLAHSLSALTVQLQALRTLLTNDPAAAVDCVDELSALARRGLEESREAIQALRTDPVQTMGLTHSLRDLLQAFQARTGLSTTLSLAGEEPDLTSAELLNLYLIAEEALTNIERHATAQRVTARLAFGFDRIDLTIRDDGAGFDPDAVPQDRFGLTGMHERAAMIGASLGVSSHPGGGTEVWCSLPR
jgi:signal transduction histidine kinase